jgi:hypothetical protein
MAEAPDRFELRERYRSMSDGELLLLAGDPESLTDEARYALKLELQNRNLSDSDIQSFAEEVKARKAQAQRNGTRTGGERIARVLSHVLGGPLLGGIVYHVYEDFRDLCQGKPSQGRQ